MDTEGNELVHAEVVAVCAGTEHGPGKPVRERIRLLVGLGVDGDCHAGATIQHRSRVARDPAQPNRRQVHLLHAELLDRLTAAGYRVAPGALGENVTTRGVDLLALPTGTRLQLGPDAVVELTGLRNPCRQLDEIQEGLMAALLCREGDRLIRLAGVMGVVVAGGELRPGDRLRVERPVTERPLEPV